MPTVFNEPSETDSTEVQVPWLKVPAFPFLMVSPAIPTSNLLALFTHRFRKNSPSRFCPKVWAEWSFQQTSVSVSWRARKHHSPFTHHWWRWTVLQSTTNYQSRGGLKPAGHLLTVETWASYLNSLSFRFVICELRLAVVPTGKDCCVVSIVYIHNVFIIWHILSTV